MSGLCSAQVQFLEVPGAGDPQDSTLWQQKRLQNNIRNKKGLSVCSRRSLTPGLGAGPPQQTGLSPPVLTPKFPSAQVTSLELSWSAFGEKKLNVRIRFWKRLGSSAHRLQWPPPHLTPTASSCSEATMTAAPGCRGARFSQNRPFPSLNTRDEHPPTHKVTCRHASPGWFQ